MFTQIVNTESKTFTVRSISITELRTWWNGIATPGHSCDVVNEYAVPGITLNDLAMLCDCEVSAFDDLTARELANIADDARVLNPHFFRLRAAVTESCEQIVQILTESFSAMAKGE